MNRKHLCAGLLALILAAALLTACTAKPTVSLKEKGLELVVSMSELAGSEVYRGAMSATNELGVAMAGMAGDYTSPKAIYAVTIPEGTVQALLSIDGELPATLTDWFEGRACVSIVNMIAARQGASTLAAVASVSYSRSFVYEALEKPTLYLYQYEGDYCVAVSFVPGDDGAVNGSASFLPVDDTLRLVSSADDVQAWLIELFGCEVHVESVS